MILNTGSRTDIPAFYSEWFYNRIKAGSVMSRNPFYPDQITRWRLDPDVIDVLVFCTKNPAPMLPRLDELDSFSQFWFVTITPYGPEIEAAVPPYREVCRSFRTLTEHVGKRAVAWRYDPILISEDYPLESHLRIFGNIAAELDGCTDQVVISFIDLYEKTKKNFPEIREVRQSDRLCLGRELSAIAAAHGMTIRTCLEGTDLAPYGVDTSGCLTKEVLEHALGEELRVPASSLMTREGCRCLLGNDIGAYNTCRHFCRYCYANYDKQTVIRNAAAHDPESPLLVGHPGPEDTIHDARQVRYRTGQLRLF